MTGALTVTNAISSSGASGGFAAVDRSTSGTAVFYRASGINRLWDSTAGDVINYNGSGNVGIGTSSPTSRLHIVSPSAAAFTAESSLTTGTPLVNFVSGSGVMATFYNNGYLNMGGPAGTSLAVTATGNVGIGTTTPTEKLEVNGNIKMTAANSVLSSGGSYISIPNGIYSSSGTAPSYFEGPLMVRNVLQNDSGAALTIGGGTSGLTNFNGPIAITTAGNLTMGGNAVIDGNGGWHRTYGGTGWYNSTYGGGFNMTDATYIRAYGSKGLYVAAPTIVNTPGLTAYGGPDAYGVVGQPSVTGYGGVIGFTQDGSKFGILGHANAYSFLGVGPIYNVGEIQSTSGGFRFPDGTLQTTASTSAGAACGGYNHLQVWLIKNSNCNVSVYQCLNGTSTLLNTFGGMATGACY
jgi:hypothetical protein